MLTPISWEYGGTSKEELLCTEILEARNSHSQPSTAELALTNALKNALLVSNEVESTAVSNAKKMDSGGGGPTPTGSSCKWR
jgi:hypothetical protein